MFRIHSTYKNPTLSLSLTNMRKYSTLLTIGRSNKRWVQESSYLTSHHIHIRHHPQSPVTPLPLPPPPLPSPPFSFSFSHVAKNRCGLLNTVSHNYSRTTLSNLSHNHLHAKLSTLQTLELSNDVVDYPLDYQVTVKDVDVISAAQAPTHDLWLPLTNLDLLLPPLAAGVFFCYKKNDDTGISTETVVKTLKKSLGIVLSTFYPLAGEIVPNRNGEPEVLCNNYGVEFVHAHADVDLQTLDLHHPDETVKGKLVPKINRGVISVQVKLNPSYMFRDNMIMQLRRHI